MKIEDKLIGLPEVKQMVGLGKSSIYELMSQGQFPRPAKVSDRAVRWSSNEVQQWIRKQLNRRSK